MDAVPQMERACPARTKRQQRLEYGALHAEAREQRTRPSYFFLAAEGGHIRVTTVLRWAERLGSTSPVRGHRPATN